MPVNKLEEVLSLNPNVYNKNVELMQKRLKELGYCGTGQKPLTADGLFGPGTLAAVNAFKMRNELGNNGASEGKIGPQSWEVLFSPNAVPASGEDQPIQRRLVYYSQEDPRWKGLLYSNHHDPGQTIAKSGCGPTCMAMVISSLTGRQVLPPVTAEFAVAHGHRTDDSGTDWGFFGNISKTYGLTCKQTGDLDEMKRGLVEGTFVVASMRFGHFTQGGHYIVISGMKHSGTEILFEVLDPNIDNTSYGKDGLIDEGTKDDGKVTAKESVFRDEARQFWVIGV